MGEKKICIQKFTENLMILNPRQIQEISDTNRQQYFKNQKTSKITITKQKILGSKISMELNFQYTYVKKKNSTDMKKSQPNISQNIGTR